MSTSVDLSVYPGADGFFIGGSWRPARKATRTELISPSTEDHIASVPLGRRTDADEAIRVARAAVDHGPWAAMAPADRAKYMWRIHDELKERRTELISLSMIESGCTRSFATWTTNRALDIWMSNALLADQLQVDEERPRVGDRRAVVRREPVGVVLAITPWNGPLVLGTLKLAAALVAGCSVVLRPAPETPLTCWVLAEAIIAAGLPDGVVGILPAGTDTTRHMVSHPDVDMVSFTGSTAVGKKIMASCARSLKRVSLELGGKSAAIMLDEVDIQATLPHLIAMSGLRAAGQICTSRTRILVSDRRHDEWVDGLREAMSKEVIGDQFDAATTLQPVISMRQRERVEGYISVGRQEGAKLVLGGGRPAHMPRGWYVEPTLFDEVDPSMRIAQEEIFGPVLSVLRYSDVDHAVEIANNSMYGLSGSVYCSDDDVGFEVATRVRAGNMNVVNGTALAGKSDPVPAREHGMGPFGGYKQSGLGREGSFEGVQEFTEIKHIEFPILA